MNFNNKMKLNNKTRYDGGELRKIILSVMLDDGVRPAYYRVYVEYARANGRFYGKGTIGGTKMWLYLDREKHNIAKLKNTILHELEHNKGLKHHDMDCDALRSHYAGEGFIYEKAVKEKQKIDLVFQRRIHAEKMVADYTTKLKRVGNLLKKWQKKAKYYQILKTKEVDKNGKHTNEKQKTNRTYARSERATATFTR